MLNGALANSVAVLCGGILGGFLKKGLPERFHQMISTGLGLCIVYVGISGSLKGENMIIMVLAMVIGAVLGELLRIDDRLRHLGDKLQSRLGGATQGQNLSGACVECSLIVCVGAMAILGSLQSGMGNHEILYTKALMDFVVALVVASTKGCGAALAAIPLFLYQGGMSLGAHYVSAVLTDRMIGEMTCVGSLAIMAIGLNMMGVTKIKVANLIIAPFLAIPLCLVF